MPLPAAHRSTIPDPIPDRTHVIKNQSVPTKNETPSHITHYASSSPVYKSIVFFDNSKHHRKSHPADKIHQESPSHIIAWLFFFTFPPPSGSQSLFNTIRHLARFCSSHSNNISTYGETDCGQSDRSFHKKCCSIIISCTYYWLHVGLRQVFTSLGELGAATPEKPVLVGTMSLPFLLTDNSKSSDEQVEDVDNDLRNPIDERCTRGRLDHHRKDGNISTQNASRFEHQDHQTLDSEVRSL